MKQCPNCGAELEHNTRFCLSCMTSLDEKERIQPPTAQRRWPLVLAAFVALTVVLVLLFCLGNKPSRQSTKATQPAVSEDSGLRQCTVDGVAYTFRPATRQEYPTAVILEQCYTLVDVEGTPPDGIYRVPSFVGSDTHAVVAVVAEGAFSGTEATCIDLGHNVRYVWGSAFGGYALQELYLHEDVFVEPEAFSGCTESLVIRCPDYLENTQGKLWSELATEYGFRWQQEPI